MYIKCNKEHSKYLPKILQCLEKMHIESSYNNIALDIHTCFENLARRLLDDNSFIYIKIDKDDNVIGVIIAELTSFIFNKDILFAHDNILYVDKEHRCSIIGVRLIKQYILWAKSKQASRIYLGESCEIENRDRLKTLFLTLGFKEFASNYVLGE